MPFSQQVYLLLDAVDEMGITSPLTTINQQLAEGWTQGLRVVLTCRLNVWEGEKNALRDFDVYRNLDFNSQQIQEFIEQWFNDKIQSQELLKQLNDWDYFLPRNHVNCPVEGKEYRIFQPQWKQVILLWLGRDDVDEGEKEDLPII